VNILSHSVGGLFSLETISFLVQEVFNFMKSHLSILSLSCWAAGVLLRKSLPIPITSRFFPTLSCTNFRVSGLILGSLIHFELILVEDDKHGSSFSFLQTDNHYPTTFVEEAVFSLLCIFDGFVKNKVGIAVWIHIWVLSSVSTLLMSLLVPVPCCI
jgi:hypothetical protein